MGKSKETGDFTLAVSPEGQVRGVSLTEASRLVAALDRISTAAARKRLEGLGALNYTKTRVAGRPKKGAQLIISVRDLLALEPGLETRFPELSVFKESDETFHLF